MRLVKIKLKNLIKKKETFVARLLFINLSSYQCVNNKKIYVRSQEIIDDDCRVESSV